MNRRALDGDENADRDPDTDAGLHRDHVERFDGRLDLERRAERRSVPVRPPGRHRRRKPLTRRARTMHNATLFSDRAMRTTTFALMFALARFLYVRKIFIRL